MKSYDYVVVGSGLAGLYAALLAQRRGEVLLLTKADLVDSNTRHAQGGIAAAMAVDDSPELHVRDTLVAGAGLCDPISVRALAEEGPRRIRELIELGVPFDRVNGEIALGREGAHSVARVLHAGGDATGANVEATLASWIRALSRVEVRDHHLLTEVLVRDGVAQGVRALDARAGEAREFAARWVILATGGAGQLFSQTTNPAVATGDGVAVAYRAGAAVVDLEFFQFHPTALALAGAPRFLISEAVRGDGGILRTADGRRFMPDYDSRAELAPRDVVARSITAEMARTGEPCVYLDVTHLAPEYVESRFPQISAYCRDWGLDFARQPVPVAPAAHYFMGGVATNVWGETTVPGLLACGEVACTGVHGANRLASNSLLETLVFSERAVRRTRQATSTSDLDYRPYISGGAALPPLLVSLASQSKRPTPPTSESARASLPESLRALMWDAVGMSRSRESLEEARRSLIDWAAGLPRPADRASHELANLLTVGRLMTEAALLREESRGAHYRADHPSSVAEWRRRILFLPSVGQGSIPSAESVRAVSVI